MLSHYLACALRQIRLHPTCALTAIGSMALGMVPPPLFAALGTAC